jgi:DNA-binding NarL/FixJ family response regulator
MSTNDSGRPLEPDDTTSAGNLLGETWALADHLVSRIAPDHTEQLLAQIMRRDNIPAATKSRLYPVFGTKDEHRILAAANLTDHNAGELVSLQTALDAIDPGVTTEESASLTSITEQLQAMIADLQERILTRNLQRDGRDLQLSDEVGIGAALSQRASRLATDIGLEVYLSLDESPERLPAAIEIELLEIAEEALSNIRRHANPSSLWLTVTIDPPRAQIRIVDDGYGQFHRGPDRFGISGMQEGARRIGADLYIGPGPGGDGTLVEVNLDTQPTAATVPRSRHGRSSMSRELHQALTEPWRRRRVPARPLRVLIVGQDPYSSHTLSRTLHREGDLEPVGEANSFTQAMTMLSQLRPNVMVVELQLPDGDGLTLVKRARVSNPLMGIVVRGILTDDDIVAALAARASAFVAWDTPTEDLVTVLRHTATQPNLFSSPGLADALQRRIRGLVEPDLTDREHRVLHLIARGLTTPQIARELGIPESLAKDDTTLIYKKLGVRDQSRARDAATRLLTTTDNSDDDGTNGALVRRT